MHHRKAIRLGFRVAESSALFGYSCRTNAAAGLLVLLFVLVVLLFRGQRIVLRILLLILPLVLTLVLILILVLILVLHTVILRFLKFPLFGGIDSMHP